MYLKTALEPEICEYTRKGRLFLFGMFLSLRSCLYAVHMDIEDSRKGIYFEKETILSMKS